MKKIPIIKLTFKKFIEEIYLFDLFAIKEENPIYIGKVEVNMHTKECTIYSNQKLDISEFRENIAQMAIDEAINKKRIIELIGL